MYEHFVVAGTIVCDLFQTANLSKRTVQKNGHPKNDIVTPVL